MDIYKPTVEESIEFAKGSSQIEGEYSPVAVRDHLQAWEFCRGLRTLNLKNILECHRMLQQDLRPDIAGKLRDCNVRVGRHIAPDVSMVSGLLNEWIAKYSNAAVFEKADDVEAAIQEAHVEFETIHPFEDGNGRVGRCLMNWHRVMNNLPVFIVEPGEKQWAYYEWFKRQSNG